MRYFQQVFKQFRDVWMGMTVAARVGFAALTALSLAIIVGVAIWASQPDYRVLFSELSVEDAGPITDKLKAQGVAYRLTAGGTNILVPAAQLQQLRIDLAAQGLPASGAKGFEMLDESPLGITPFREHVNYGRALEAELARTITKFESVAFARVHIVRPESTPFVRDQKPTTASVMLKLKPAATLNRTSAASIVALVCHAVEGLTPENVSVVDTAGHLLSERSDSETGALAANHLEYRRDMESLLASKAEEMLTKLLGPGRSIVRVSADLNFQRMTEEKQDYDPENKVVKTEKVVNRKSGMANQAQGAAGTASNLSRNPPRENAGSSNSLTEETIDTEYAVSLSKKTLVQDVGQVQRLTIAVMVDLPSAEGEGAVGAMSVKDAEEIVRQAVGFKEGRDEIHTVNTKLVGVPGAGGNDVEWAKAEQWQSYIAVARNASLGVAALVALLLGRMVLKRFLPVVESPAAPPQSVSADVLERLASAVQQDPEAVARLLARWVEESEERPAAAA